MIYLIGLIVFLTVVYIYWSTFSIELKRVNYKTDKIGNELKILHLSDFHFKGYGKLERNLRKKLKKLDYDLVILTGDYVSGNNIDGFEEFIARLGFKRPVYGVLGNHDYLRLERLETSFKNNGIELLNNRSVIYNKSGDLVNITGVGSPDIGYDDLNKAIENINLSNGLNLLISHTYDIIEDVKVCNYELIFAGDTHGGQIKLPFFGRVIFKRLLGLEYVSGLYIINGSKLFINRGLGTSGLPFRINCRPEITLFKINPKK